MMICRNRDQAKRIKICESELRLIENDYDAALMDRDTLYNDHQSYSVENKMLNDEIDRVLMAIMEAEKNSNEMQQELNNYMVIDDEAMKLINRGDRTVGILGTVQLRLSQTGQNISHLR
jgi:hypothetical protein